ncbi:BTAD domain-containing putative transcriptional regulator [Mycobacterium kansasii]|uniref:BTAD domain-containing putative transcriptional regulator n=1 Tax=Mycobacterium kansasii TaxID=1768 RepID=UPI000CDD1586|nr:BTAD domain-containing putative transcriptional regulator [Mycobacterium kansasii]POX69197.1 AfsR/SARP family transcriptional regulator [Mycobacterium kansasii]POY10062.1 AfsR/SARP family transcriptional regulator [Mycobacterium kansasii]
MSVEFCLLGDVAVHVDGQRLDIGHARQRCVLVALLVDVNHPIAVDHLVDHVWSDHPPHHARNSLAGYVSRLRNLFSDTRGVALARESGGYVLQTDAMSVDLHRFRHVVRQARGCQDPLQAADLFERALGIWRGEPFPALDTPWINSLRSTLLGERLSVVLDRNDVALRVGRHSEVLVELTAAHAAHPLDERLAGQLMLAQYRSGRQADALDTYRQMRQRLADELGVDPGASLDQVHQQILSGDEQSPGPAPTPHLVVPDRPHSALLRRTTSFVGHTHEVARVIESMAEGPLVTLTGVGGVGKTRLALEVARREQDRFSDGVAICELAPLEHGAAVSHTIATALHLQQQQGLGIEESVIEYLRAREVLLVADNCEHVVEAVAQLLARIIQHCPKVAVLTTSRQPLAIDGERIVVVPPLTVDDATRLFADRARAGRPDFHLQDQPEGAVAEICRLVDCLPLAVELAAARMRMMSSTDVIRRLDTLGVLRGGARGSLPRQQSMSAAIDWSYQLLTQAEQALFLRLSVFAGSFDLDAAHGVCGSDGDVAEDTLDLLAGLVDKSMVVVRSVTGRTRYGILETLRAFGREHLREAGLTDTYAARHATYYTELAERAATGLHDSQEQDWVERMMPDYDNLRAAFERAMADTDTDLALRLVAALPELLGLRIGYEMAEWAERLITVTRPEHPLFATAVGVAARGAWAHGDYAHARSLAELAQRQVPGPGTARVAYPADVLADVTFFEGDSQWALDYWEGEVTRARADADPIRLVWTLYEVAICSGALGKPDYGLPAAQEAVTLADSTGNPTARSMAYFSLGYLLKRSEPVRATALFDQAAELAAAVQNFWHSGTALMSAAATRAVHGDPIEAARMFIEVLDHWDRVGDWFEQGAALRYITRLLLRLGADDDAAFLHCAFIKAGMPSPLRDEQLETLVDRLGANRFEAHRVSVSDSAAMVARARSSLHRFVTPPA